LHEKPVEENSKGMNITKNIYNIICAIPNLHQTSDKVHIIPIIID